MPQKIFAQFLHFWTILHVWSGFPFEAFSFHHCSSLFKCYFQGHDNDQQQPVPLHPPLCCGVCRVPRLSTASLHRHEALRHHTDHHTPLPHGTSVELAGWWQNLPVHLRVSTGHLALQPFQPSHAAQPPKPTDKGPDPGVRESDSAAREGSGGKLVVG